MARFVAPHAFSAALRIVPWSSISRPTPWISRASLNISSMRFVLVVMVPSEELRNQTLQKAVNRLVLQRRFLNLVRHWPEIASRKAWPQSCQARGQVAMKKSSRSLSCEASL